MVGPEFGMVCRRMGKNVTMPLGQNESVPQRMS